ncbi:restriction endonuclease subunit S [Enterobacter sp. C4G1]|uniref:restriction endonuclease subunit S n=1 Tax=Enterobacter sp. C4G1 TaxID=3458724 RepID=UPI0040680FDC
MVPKLRFREFKEHWESTYLGDIASKIGSGSTPKGGSEVYKSTGIPFIRSQNVYDEQLNLKDLVFISSDIDEKMKGSRVKPGDILLNITGASIGRSCVVPENFKQGNVNQHVCIIRLPSNSPKFFQAFISSEKGQKLIDSSQSGSGREGLNFENIRNFLIYSPSVIEQTKISYFLSSVDKKISLLSKQYELLYQYKKGIMQKIFSQELRFKGSTPWKSENLFGLAVNNTLTNGVFNDPMNTGSGYKLINVVNMYKEPHIDENDLTRLNLDEKTFNKNKVKNGDIFFTRSSLVKEGIAWSNIYLGNSDDITYDGHLIKMTPDKTKVFPQFLYYCLKTSQVRSQLIKGGKTATMTTIGQDDVGKTSLHIPSLNEQIKIANFLSAIDDKITTKKVELDKLKTWKQGLLQQMFV